MANIVEYIPTILIAYFAFTLALISPGPNVLAIMATSMEVGRKQALSMTYGVALGTFLIGSSAAVGLASLLNVYVDAIYVIKTIGAIYLFWLAIKAFKTAYNNPQPIAGKVKQNASLKKLFASGLLVQITNPKSIMAWVAILSIGLNNTTPIWVVTTIVLGTALISLVINATYAILFSSQPAINLYKKSGRSIQFTFGVFFSFTAFKLAISKV